MSVAPVSRRRAGTRVVIRAAAVTTALLTTLGLAACGSDNSDDRQTESASSSTPTLADLVGQTWEKETPAGTGKITLDSASINAPCAYGEGYDSERGKVTEDMNVLQLTLTYDFTDVTENQWVLGPTALWADGSKAVIPDDVGYLSACKQTDSSDETIMITQAGEAGTVRTVYYTSVLPTKVTGLKIHDKVVDLGPVTPRTSDAGHAPSPTVVPPAAAEPDIAGAPVDAADTAVVPDITPEAVEPPAESTYTPEIGPNGYPLDPDIPGANQPLPGEPGYEEWQEYLDGLSNAERSNYGISAATPNDCDDFLGAHEDGDRSNCPT